MVDSFRLGGEKDLSERSELSFSSPALRKLPSIRNPYHLPPESENP